MGEEWGHGTEDGGSAGQRLHRSCIPFLERPNLQRSRLERGDAFRRRTGAGKGGDTGNAVLEGRLADRRVVDDGFSTQGCVDHQVDIPVDEAVEHVGPSLMDLLDLLYGDPLRHQVASRPRRRYQGESLLPQPKGDGE